MQMVKGIAPESGGDAGVRAGSAHQSGVDDERTPARSSQSEGADRRAGRDDEGESVSLPKSRDSQCHDRERFGELGDRATGLSSSEPPETASDESGPDYTDESTEDQVDGSRKGKLQCPSPAPQISSLVGISVPGSPLRMSPAVEQNVPQQQPPQDLAWTTTAMERWGQKLVSWGKKHPGKLYSVVYETDAQYVGWCLSRINSLEAPISDFARYCQTRQQMEEQLRRSQGFA